MLTPAITITPAAKLESILRDFLEKIVSILTGCSKKSTFRYFASNWDISPLFERFMVFICICLTFTQSQCSHCSFVQANHLLNKIPQIISKAIFRTSLTNISTIRMNKQVGPMVSDEDVAYIIETIKNAIVR